VLQPIGQTQVAEARGKAIIPVSPVHGAPKEESPSLPAPSGPPEESTQPELDPAPSKHAQDMLQNTEKPEAGSAVAAILAATESAVAE
jgi:hypothetical protein